VARVEGGERERWGREGERDRERECKREKQGVTAEDYFVFNE
jgi:hypothetical protein